MLFLRMNEKKREVLYSFCLRAGTWTIAEKDCVVAYFPRLKGVEDVSIYRIIPCRKGIVLIDKEKRVYFLSIIQKKAGKEKLGRMKELDGADYVYISDTYTFVIKNDKLYMNQGSTFVTSSKLVDVPCPDSIAVVEKEGFETVFVLTKTKEVYAFGSNQYGLLGKGRKFPLLSIGYDSPVKIDLPPIRKIEGENGKMFALAENGKLYGWGCNEEGGILADLPIGRIGSPCSVFENVKDFSVGTDHGLLLTNDGEVYGWGKVSAMLLRGFKMNELDFVNTTPPVRIPIETCRGAENDFVLSVHVDQYLSVVCTSRGLIVWGFDLWNVFNDIVLYNRSNEAQSIPIEAVVKNNINV